MNNFNIVPPDSLGSDCRIINRVPFTRQLAQSPFTMQFPITLNEPVGDELDGAVLDFETTGFKHESDEVIEVGVLRFTYSPSAQRVSQITGVFNEFEQPSKPLEPIITEITGLVDADLEGRKIDDVAFAKFLDGITLIVAHNAPFDKGFFEKRFPQFEPFKWGCSAQGDVDWRSLGYPSSGLTAVLNHQGFFYDAHRATIDCMATLWALFTHQPAFKKLLESYDQQAFTVRAVGAPFEVKEQLKSKGFRWSSEKVWTITVKGDDAVKQVTTQLYAIYGQSGVVTPVK